MIFMKNCPRFLFWKRGQYHYTSPKMPFVRTMHILLSSSQLNKTAAFSTSSLSERTAPSAYIKPAAVLAFTAPFFLGQSGDHLGDFHVYPVWVKLLEKAFFAERSAHFSVTQTTEQGGSSAVTVPFSSFTAYSAGAMRSGTSKSLQA